MLRSVAVGFVVGLYFSLTRPRRRRRLTAACVEGTSWESMEVIDRSAALKALNPDIPAAIQTGPTSALLLSHGETLDTCEEVDVVVAQAGAGRCLLVAGTQQPSFRVTRHERVDEAWQPIARIREGKQRMPTDSTRRRARALFVRLVSSLEDVAAELDPVLAAAAQGTRDYRADKGAVLLMCINAGNLDLLLNFVLSTKRAGFPVDNLVVFAADEQTDGALKSAGIRTFRHEALGDFRSEAARSYGDHQFVEMMWLKITCVFLVNYLGYDLLFQDADLVWWQSPWPFFDQRPQVDSFWMDDGARTARFAPHYPNTGFYLVRANPRTQLFARQLLGSYSTVLAWQSHQALVSQLLAENHALFGLTVHILDKEQFPSGKQLHHNRPLFDRIHAGNFTPYCFHMCWTAGKPDKLKFLKQEQLWFLPDSCPLSRLVADPRPCLS